MTITQTNFDDVFIFTPAVYYDDRGFFLESFNQQLQDHLNIEFLQDNHSLSKKNVFRGLHYNGINLWVS